MIYGHTDEEMARAPFTGWRKSAKRILCILSRIYMFCCGFHVIKINGKRASKKEVILMIY